jgi:hypothetical protein
MSYEHCELHDCDATNGCPHCKSELADTLAKDKFCSHLQKHIKRVGSINPFVHPEEVDLVRRTHVYLHVRSSPIASRADLNEHVFLCAICSGELMLFLNRIEREA